MPQKQRRTSFPSYLKQRRLGWYVQVAVPAKLQVAVGAKVLTRSLGTRDEAEARKRRHAVIAELQSLVAQAAARDAPEESSAGALLETASTLRASVDSGESTEHDADAAFDAAADRYLATRAKALGRDQDGHPDLPRAEAATVRRAHALLAGRLQYTLASLVESYLAESTAHLRAQSIGDKRRHLSAFVEWFGIDREAAEVTRKAAGTYVGDVIQKRTQRAPGASAGDPEVPLSAVTKRKEISALRSFFDWTTARGVTDANPFDRMASTIKTSSRGSKPKRRPWQAAELETVFRGLPANDPVWTLTAIAAYTGMRREEVAELKTSSVDGDIFIVEAGKTVAAVRRVPVHPALAPLVRQLLKTSKDGFLISDLLRGGPDKKRAWYVGKRFGRAIRSLGILDPSLDFHALRGTVITQMEAAGIPESTIQLIVGHKRQGITFGVYSAGVPDATKRAAIGHISYGKTLDLLVAKLGNSVVISSSAAARPRRRGVNK